MHVLHARLHVLYIGSASSWTTCIKLYKQKCKEILTAITTIVKVTFMGARYGRRQYGIKDKIALCSYFCSNQTT